MTLNEALENYVKNWQINGLGMLDLGDRQEWGSYGYTVKNDNGILFSVIILTLLRKMKLSNTSLRDMLYANIVIGENLLRKGPVGLYCRRPNQDSVLEAQDNYAALAAIGPQVAKRICSWGEKHFWNFNNMPPYAWKLEAQRQPGEIAYYQICAEEEPGMFSFSYMCAGLLVNAYDKKASPSDTQLAWLRIETIDRVGIFGFLKREMFKKVKSIWFKKMEEKFPGGMPTVFKRYYRAEHPIHEIAKECFK